MEGKCRAAIYSGLFASDGLVCITGIYLCRLLKLQHTYTINFIEHKLLEVATIPYYNCNPLSSVLVFMKVSVCACMYMCIFVHMYITVFVVSGDGHRALISNTITASISTPLLLIYFLFQLYFSLLQPSSHITR